MLSLASFQNLCCAAPTPVSCVTMLCTLANTIIQLSFRTPNVKKKLCRWIQYIQNESKDLMGSGLKLEILNDSCSDFWKIIKFLELYRNIHP